MQRIRAAWTQATHQLRPLAFLVGAIFNSLLFEFDFTVLINTLALKQATTTISLKILFCKVSDSSLEEEETGEGGIERKRQLQRQPRVDSSNTPDSPR